MSVRSYLQENVFEAALNRIRRLYDEFGDHIIVNTSGGKDSTIILHLTLKVAEERGMLPLKVLFIDQEAEWQAVINHIRQVYSDPRIEPIWLQLPLRISSATSPNATWLHCWEEEKKHEWIRQKEPDSIHENTFGTDRLKHLFGAVVRAYWPNEPGCSIGGVRCEESPSRTAGLTNYATYKDITWGSVADKRRGHYTFYPIYDWSYTDVWKAIHDNGWPYCPIYDYYYQYGVPLVNMRVSHVHHETAMTAMFVLQEIEPDTWNKVVMRVPGLNTAGHLQRGFLGDGQLPFMFSSWHEYRDYLLENIITRPEIKEKFRQQFQGHEGRYIPEVQEQLNKTEVRMLLLNDSHGTKLTVFHAVHGFDAIKFRVEHGLPLTGRIPKGYVHVSYLERTDAS